MLRQEWRIAVVFYNVYVFVNNITKEEFPVMANGEEEAWKELEKGLEETSVATDFESM